MAKMFYNIRSILLWIFIGLLSTTLAYADAPQKFSYQAVIRDADGELVTNGNIGMQVSILQSSPEGAAVYIERHSPTTNDNGLVSLQIGGGTVVLGSMEEINWAEGPYFIQTETDLQGGSNYTLAHTSELLSVPYAMHATTAEALSEEIVEIDPVFMASPAAGILLEDIDNWDEAHSWGDHSLEEYLTDETDPLFTASPAGDIEDSDILNWDEAHSWGDHSQEGYIDQEEDPLFSASPAFEIEDADITKWDEAFSWGDHDGLYRPDDWTPDWSDMPLGDNPGEMRYWDGNQWLPIDPPEQDGQFLSFVEGVPKWHGSISQNTQPPTVLALDADPVAEFSATINGIVNPEGFSTIVVFEWGTDTDYGNTVTAIQSPVAGSDDVAVHAALSGLQAATTYHYRIKATSAVDVIYSEDMMFTTQTSIPQLNTLAVSDITPFSAVSGGNITYDGGLPVTDRGVVWGMEANPDIENYDGITSDGTGSGTFTSNITDLSPETVYYVRAYATNDNGTEYGDQQTFTTLGAEPTATTEQATDITTESAVLNASVNPNHLETTVIFEWGLTDEYGNEITAEQSPIEGSTNVSVSALIDGLEPGTTYHFGVEAENELGVVFGNARTFTTYGVDDPQDIDGNYYRTVIIGDQEWTAENLHVTRYNNGDAIPTGLSNSEWENTTNGAYATSIPVYGNVYNWFTVNDPRGLCPEGWSVPGHDEWTQLEQYICNALGNSNCDTQFPYDNTTTGLRGTNEGNALKSCRQVVSPLGGDCDTSEHPRWDSNVQHYGFDEFGFSALPGGARYTGGSFGNLGTLGYWWSSTESSSADAWSRSMSHGIGGVYRNDGNKTHGHSLRCVRDID